MVDSPSIEKIMAGIKEILSQPTDVLISNYRNSSGTVRFTLDEAKIPMNDLKSIFQNIKAEAIALLPDRSLSKFITTLNTIFANIRQLHEFNIARDASIESAQRQLSGFYHEGRSDGIYLYMDTLWPLVMDSITLLNNQLNLSNNRGIEQLNAINENLKTSEAYKEQFREILAAARAELTQKGVSKHAAIFSDQAKAHNKNASNWKIASIVLIIINFLLIAGALFLVVVTPVQDRLIVSISSVLTISLMSYCIVLTVRNYFAEKHNEVINCHKANCLNSYNTFVEGANEDVKAAVLQFTTQTIFSQYNPGFLNKDGIQSPSPILEVLRTVSPKS